MGGCEHRKQFLYHENELMSKHKNISSFMNMSTKNVHFGYVPKSSSKKIIKIQYHVNEWDRAIKDGRGELAIGRIVTTRRTNPFSI